MKFDSKFIENIINKKYELHNFIKSEGETL